MSDEQPQYRPDTVVNGHVLIEDAQWVTMQGPVDPTPAERTRMSGVAKLASSSGFCGWLVASQSSLSVASQSSPTSPRRGTPQPQLPNGPGRHRPEATCQCRQREEPGRSRTASAPRTPAVTLHWDGRWSRRSCSICNTCRSQSPTTRRNARTTGSTSPPTARRLPNDHDTSDR